MGFRTRSGTQGYDGRKWYAAQIRGKLHPNFSDWEEAAVMNVYWLIALVIVVLIIAAFGIYLVISNRQRDMEGDLKHLAELLEDDGRD